MPESEANDLANCVESMSLAIPIAALREVQRYDAALQPLSCPRRISVRDGPLEEKKDDSSTAIRFLLVVPKAL